MELTLVKGLDENCRRVNKGESFPLVQIAADGITLPKTFERTTTFIAPGYRIEAMVQMPNEETNLCLISDRDVTNESGIPEPDVLLIINVRESAGEPTSTAMPTDNELLAISPPTQWRGRVEGEMVDVSCNTLETYQQKVVMMIPAITPDPDQEISDGGPCDPNEHPHKVEEQEICDCQIPNINCRKFDERRERGYSSDRIMSVGSTERWQAMATDGHPIHIHVNPFVACAGSSTQEPPFPHWRDTYFVRANLPVDLLMEYRMFTGRFTLHCHKLNHEDDGMMELVEICPEGDQDCLCLGTDNEGNCISSAGCFEEDIQCQFAAKATEAFPLPPTPEMCPVSSSN